MKIKYNANMLRLEIDDIDRASWLDGRSLFYSTPKDHRPDMYNVQDIDDVYHSYYQLGHIGATDQEKENLKHLADIYVAYADHVLGSVIQRQQPSDSKGEIE